MTQRLFIGVDGGATKVIVRVEDEQGNLIGREQGGPANIRISVENAWQSIHSALDKILKPLNIHLADQHYQIHAGMGLAGCELVDAEQAFLNYPHPFNTLIVTSDAHAACLGAHVGADGAIIVIGTGTVGFQLKDNQITKVGGWGFPHDDEGGGASIGLAALKLTLKWLDQRKDETLLTKAIYAHFAHDLNRLVDWANHANSTTLAKLAPIVIACAEAEDQSAKLILRRAAHDISDIAATLFKVQSKTKPLPLTLVGGLAPFIQPYLEDELKKRLSPCQRSPDAGAILLIRRYVERY